MEYNQEVMDMLDEQTDMGEKTQEKTRPEMIASADKRAKELMAWLKAQGIKV